MSQENVEIVRRSLDGWNRGDVDTWLASAHPEVEWFSAVARKVEGPETVYRGVAGMRRFWEEWATVWELEIEVSELRDLGDTVVALGEVQVHGGASGIDMGGPVAYVFEFAEGLVRTARSYLDWNEALEAAGLSE